MEELNSVQEFYVEKTIFITGASGFMGKVLLEKLLHCCSGVKIILILMREKRGKSPKERVESFKNLELFERVRNEKPELFEKICPVFGEVTQANFGLDAKDLKRVCETTEIFFHMAASLKMEAPLRPNVLSNLVGTKNALQMAKNMRNLIHMQHLSTAFCNVEPKTVFEKVYECHHEPEDLIRMSEWMSDEAMESMQKELLGPHPNTYTYTKRLAEILVQREYARGLPVCIVRPTVVMPTYRDPFPGWVDSLNGVVGIFVAGGKGVLRSMLVDAKARSEYIAADTLISALIVIPKILSSSPKREEKIPVYHVTCDDSQKLKMGEIFQMVKTIGQKFPLSWALWYADGNITMNRYVNAFNIFCFQLVPAYIIDFLLRCFKQKPFLVHVQHKIAVGTEVLQFFTMRSWDFNQKNFQNLIMDLSPSEYDMFLIDCKMYTDEYTYIEHAVLGGRQYCAKDPLSTLPTARVVNKIQYVLHILVRILFYWFVITSLLKAFGVYEPVKEYFAEKSHVFSLRQ